MSWSTRSPIVIDRWAAPGRDHRRRADAVRAGSGLPDRWHGAGARGDQTGLRHRQGPVDRARACRASRRWPAGAIASSSPRSPSRSTRRPSWSALPSWCAMAGCRDISDLRDESDRKGMRIVIELKRGAAPRKVLNQLFKYTPLQTHLRRQYAGAGRRRATLAQPETRHSALRRTPDERYHPAHGVPPAPGARAGAHLGGAAHCPANSWTR